MPCAPNTQVQSTCLCFFLFLLLGFLLASVSLALGCRIQSGPCVAQICGLFIFLFLLLGFLLASVSLALGCRTQSGPCVDQRLLVNFVCFCFCVWHFVFVSLLASVALALGCHSVSVCGCFFVLLGFLLAPVALALGCRIQSGPCVDQRLLVNFVCLCFCVWPCFLFLFPCSLQMLWHWAAPQLLTTFIVAMCCPEPMWECFIFFVCALVPAPFSFFCSACECLRFSLHRLCNNALKLTVASVGYWNHNVPGCPGNVVGGLRLSAFDHFSLPPPRSKGAGARCNVLQGCAECAWIQAGCNGEMLGWFVRGACCAVRVGM
jgi:hypothetical protein